ncbi:hypothetical protein E2C01_052518 [Portunus trituberculatus]|uniref:Uncharacterized protein n=1 Tax=Portunus trituberculatus TaxID=210409 RepID=A0A5B7GHW4_PORTR|nr:hypothetical protein [Portunus trituberculatus]
MGCPYHLLLPSPALPATAAATAAAAAAAAAQCYLVTITWQILPRRAAATLPPRLNILSGVCRAAHWPAPGSRVAVVRRGGRAARWAGRRGLARALPGDLPPVLDSHHQRRDAHPTPTPPPQDRASHTHPAVRLSHARSFPRRHQAYPSYPGAQQTGRRRPPQPYRRTPTSACLN